MTSWEVLESKLVEELASFNIENSEKIKMYEIFGVKKDKEKYAYALVGIVFPKKEDWYLVRVSPEEEAIATNIESTLLIFNEDEVKKVDLLKYALQLCSKNKGYRLSRERAIGNKPALFKRCVSSDVYEEFRRTFEQRTKRPSYIA